MTKARALLLTVGASVIILSAGRTARADEEITHFKIYGGPAYVSALDEENISFGTIVDSIQTQDHIGWNLGLEGRFNHLLGIELDYVDADQDVEFGGTTIGDTTFSPLTATLNFHLIPGNHFDLYLGPSYSWVNWGDIHVNDASSGITGSSTVATDSTSGWGVSLGFDFSPWKHFSFYAGLKYLNVDLALSNGQSASMNPLMGRLGVAARF